MRAGEPAPRFQLLILAKGRGKKTHMAFPNPGSIRKGVLYSACGRETPFAKAAERLAWRLATPTCKSCRRYEETDGRGAVEGLRKGSIVLGELLGLDYPLDETGIDPDLPWVASYREAFEAYRTGHA